MKNVPLVCWCCGGKWRGRILVPKADQEYLAAYEVKVICSRCNSRECGTTAHDQRCSTGRHPHSS